MESRRVADSEVSAIALGSTPFGFAGSSHDADSIRTMHAAFDAGVTVVDTALAYTGPDEPQHGERIVAEAVRTSGHEVVVATKGGHWRAPSGDFPIDGRPETLRLHCELSRRGLGVEEIWLYYLHWPDPKVPIEESVGALADLQHEGAIRHVGVSNVDPEQLDRARRTAAIAAVQNPFSVLRGGDRGVLDACTAAGIAFFAYSPLGGPGAAKSLGETVPSLGGIAAKRGVSPQRIALAWLLAQGPAVVPVVAASSAATIGDAAAAADLVLDDDELRALGGRGEGVRLGR